MPAMTQQHLENHLWGAADILRGSVDAGAHMTYIFALLFYKRLCDLWEEEYEAVLKETGDKEEAADPCEHRFHIPAGHFWRDIRKSATDIGQRLNNAFQGLTQNVRKGREDNSPSSVTCGSKPARLTTLTSHVRIGLALIAAAYPVLTQRQRLQETGRAIHVYH